MRYRRSRGRRDLPRISNASTLALLGRAHSRSLPFRDESVAKMQWTEEFFACDLKASLGMLDALFEELALNRKPRPWRYGDMLGENPSSDAESGSLFQQESRVLVDTRSSLPC